MDTLKYILTKFDLDGLPIDIPMPIEISNFGRNQLAGLIHDLDFKAGAEVGVAEGEYSEVLCQKNPQMALWGIDPYLHYSGYTDYVKKSTFNKLRENALKRLIPYRNFLLIEKMSTDAAQDFKDNSLDFVYIDANHKYPYVIEDLRTWIPKVKIGGIISGHDYFRASHIQVREALADYTEDNNIKPWFVLGREAKNTGEIRDDVRSWMFIKI